MSDGGIEGGIDMSMTAVSEEWLAMCVGDQDKHVRSRGIVGKSERDLASRSRSASNVAAVVDRADSSDRRDTSKKNTMRNVNAGRDKTRLLG